MTEQHRMECEARAWLDKTGGIKAQVDDAMELVEKKRGKAAADQLRAEMRRQYQMRARG